MEDLLREFEGKIVSALAEGRDQRLEDRRLEAVIKCIAPFLKRLGTFESSFKTRMEGIVL